MGDRIPRCLRVVGTAGSRTKTGGPAVQADVAAGRAARAGPHHARLDARAVASLQLMAALRRREPPAQGVLPRAVDQGRQLVPPLDAAGVRRLWLSHAHLLRTGHLLSD